MCCEECILRKYVFSRTEVQYITAVRTLQVLCSSEEQHTCRAGTGSVKYECKCDILLQYVHAECHKVHIA